MEIGIVGLGRMGGSMARRLARAGVRVVGFDPDAAVRSALHDDRTLDAAESVQALVRALPAPRVVWLMVPAGTATELAIEDVWPELARGDVIVDGGNSNYKDSQRRAAALATAGIHFVDCGVSGGVWGLENGYTLMFGADPEAAQATLPLLKILAPAPDRGYLYCGPPGAGHFVKMIHNGIEYGMMQAYAEGFALMKGKRDFALDLAAIAETWRHGSVIRSWLLDLTAEFLQQDADLTDVAAMARFASQGHDEYTGRMLAMMRKGFGGHAVQKKRPPTMIVVLMGVTGSGKTTVGRALAESLRWAFYDADDFHPPANVAKMASGVPLTDNDRWPWLDRIADLLAHVQARGDHAVLACSALKQIYRDRIARAGAVRFVFLQGDLATIEARLATRRHKYMPASLLPSQIATLEEPTDALVVDIRAEVDAQVSAIRDGLHLETASV